MSVLVIKGIATVKVSKSPWKKFVGLSFLFLPMGKPKRRHKETDRLSKNKQII